MPLRKRHVGLAAAAAVGVAVVIAADRLLPRRPRPAARAGRRFAASRSDGRAARRRQPGRAPGQPADDPAERRRPGAVRAARRRRTAQCSRSRATSRCRSTRSHDAVAAAAATAARSCPTSRSAAATCASSPSRVQLRERLRTAAHPARAAARRRRPRPLQPPAGPAAAVRSAGSRSPPRSAGSPPAACWRRSPRSRRPRSRSARPTTSRRACGSTPTTRSGSWRRSFNAMLERLERSRAALDESVRAQRQLVADASHELRTPVTSLRTNIEVLLAGGELGDEDRRRLLADVVEQSEELSALVGDLIELARGDQPHRGRPRTCGSTGSSRSRSRARGATRRGIDFEAQLEPGDRRGRPRAARARGQQPARQRRPPLAAGRHRRGDASIADGVRVRDHGDGRRPGGPAPRVRPLLPRRQRARQPGQRPRARDRPPGRRAARRPRDRRATRPTAAPCSRSQLPTTAPARAGAAEPAPRQCPRRLARLRPATSRAPWLRGRRPREPRLARGLETLAQRPEQQREDGTRWPAAARRPALLACDRDRHDLDQRPRGSPRAAPCASGSRRSARER